MVRTAVPGDAAAIVAGINTICSEGNAFYISHFVPSIEWEAVLYRPDSAPNQLLLVAEWNGQFAGSGNLFAGAGHTLFQHVGSIGLFVLPPYRRSGIGKLLLEQLLSRGRQMGLERVTLSVFANNWKALRLYECFGFIEEGRQKKQIKISTGYTDLIFMARFLSD